MLLLLLIGETQLRARRTRIRILRAISEKDGSAGFSDIQNATALSTSSIYYHIERMKEYIKKSSRNYSITKKGQQLLIELDSKSKG
mgnify:FL=1